MDYNKTKEAAVKEYVNDSIGDSGNSLSTWEAYDMSFKAGADWSTDFWTSVDTSHCTTHCVC